MNVLTMGKGTFLNGFYKEGHLICIHLSKLCTLRFFLTSRNQLIDIHNQFNSSINNAFEHRFFALR